MDFKAALDKIVEQIVLIVSKMLEAAPFDKTYVGVVRSYTKPSNTSIYKINVEIDGKVRAIKSRSYVPVNSNVKVLVPKNNWEQAQIAISDTYMDGTFSKTIKLRPVTGTTPTVTTNLASVIPLLSTGIIQIGLIYDGSVNAGNYQTTMSFVRNSSGNAAITIQQVSSTNPFTVTITSQTTLNIKCPTTTSASSVVVFIMGSSC